MFTVDELLSKRNQNNAMEHMLRKRNGQGYDGVRVSEFPDYWKLNSVIIEEMIRNKKYEPGIIMTYEILNGKGKKRDVSSLNVTDRYIARLLSQKLKRYLDPQFLSNSFAYQEGKGILDAVVCAQNYINSGDSYVTVIDVKDYFDSINLEKMMDLLREKIHDQAVLHLINSYLYCKIEVNDAITDKKVGIVQGNPISPVLSNLYLNQLDEYMENQSFHWIRFADDIHVYAKNRDKASIIFTELCNMIKSTMGLEINERKSGIFSSLENVLLGYDFYKYGGKVEAKKHKYQRIENYNNWHSCSISKVNNEYHILQDGVLNKQDYALLFENEKEKHHIPIGSLEQINMYSDVTVSPSVIRLLAKSNVKVMYVDKYGNRIGQFIPEGYDKDAKTMLLQVQEYNNESMRNEVARSLEISGLHNMRSNLRYYNKKTKGKLDSVIEELNRCIEEVRIVPSVDKLMLIEARARQHYYQAFNIILQKDDFIFLSRSKQPPKDEINALISFGNTLLYNQILQLIWKTSINPQIGIVHFTNRRSYSLNLDFADLFKPLVVDRAIFTVVNRLQIKKSDFNKTENGAVLLSQEGKRCFINAFNEKMADKIVINNREFSYRELILNEIRKYKKHLHDKSTYKPYKYN